MNAMYSEWLTRCTGMKLGPMEKEEVLSDDGGNVL